MSDKVNHYFWIVMRSIQDRQLLDKRLIDDEEFAERFRQVSAPIQVMTAIKVIDPFTTFDATRVIDPPKLIPLTVAEVSQAELTVEISLFSWTVAQEAADWGKNDEFGKDFLSSRTDAFLIALVP